MPRHGVRGHWSYYGPAYNRGLLFGRYAGKIYKPFHHSGSTANGNIDKDYRIATPPKGDVA